MELLMFLLRWSFFSCACMIYFSVCMLFNGFDTGKYYLKFGKLTSILAILFSIPFVFLDTAIGVLLLFMAGASLLLAVNYAKNVNQLREAGNTTTITMHPHQYEVSYKKYAHESPPLDEMSKDIPECNTVFTSGNNVIYMMQYVLNDNAAEWKLLCHHIKDENDVSYWSCLLPVSVTRNASYLRIIRRVICFVVAIALIAVTSIQASIHAVGISVDREVIVGNSNLMLILMAILVICKIWPKKHST